MKISHIYIKGADDELKENLVRKSGFQKGSLPMKYLGVSLSPKKWNSTDCQVVTDKVTKRISHWTSRLLTYAGRVTLINSIMF